jgi:hypothetical protein
MSAMKNKFAVYVPSTINGNVPSPGMQAQFTNYVLERLAKLFGGATAIDGEGAWISDTKGLVVEPVKIVFAFADDEKATIHRPDVIALAREVAQGMTQECVSVELDNSLIFVSPEVAQAA